MDHAGGDHQALLGGSAPQFCPLFPSFACFTGISAALIRVCEETPFNWVQGFWIWQGRCPEVHWLRPW